MSSADGAYVARNMAFFDPENFNNEPICCTATVENDKDILCEGSDDDAYPTAADRLRRYEERANNFLEGTRPLILSARLRGPFDKDSGWINPWASKRPPAKKKAPKRKRAATTTTTRPPRKRKKGLGELPVVEELPMEEQLPEVNPTTVPGDRNHQDPAARRVYLDDDKADRVREWADKIAPDFEPVASFSGFEEALGAPPRRGPRRKRKDSSRRTSSAIPPDDQDAPSERESFADASHVAIALAIAAIAQEDGVPVIDLGEQLEVSNDLPQLVQQSPWARGDSQVTALVKPRPLSPILSPFSSPRLPEPEILEPVLPQLRATEKTTPSDPSQPPTTPERLTSSLPTPEFTHPIKSFREFMTPSPPKRRPLAPKSSNGRFPSTQVLEEAAVSNPWARMSCTQPPRSATSSLRKIRKTKTKTKKSVSWAPLPDEPEQQPHTPSTKPTPATRSTPTPTPTLRSRPASPPPSSLVSAEDLPISEQKFAKHFAAVKAARRRLSGMRNGMRRGSTTPTLWKMKNAPQLLPSESQQICPSPAMGAMAEAFLRADEVLNLGVQGVEEEGKELGAEAGLVEEGEEEEEDEHEETQQSVDDVSHVLENLDDFLGSWDVETELEKERKESRKGKENRKEGEEEEGWMRREGGMSVGLGLGAMGMADELLGKGVWD
ncbi:hypothetical protein QBC39DRAFT_370790 [Podospora conica]|nr:hypothetical protein QBC39DRAFT_370790 [Schizothecium conicum]